MSDIQTAKAAAARAATDDKQKNLNQAELSVPEAAAAMMKQNQMQQPAQIKAATDKKSPAQINADDAALEAQQRIAAANAAKAKAEADKAAQLKGFKQTFAPVSPIDPAAQKIINVANPTAQNNAPVTNAGKPVTGEQYAAGMKAEAGPQTVMTPNGAAVIPASGSGYSFGSTAAPKPTGGMSTGGGGAASARKPIDPQNMTTSDENKLGKVALSFADPKQTATEFAKTIQKSDFNLTDIGYFLTDLMQAYAKSKMAYAGQTYETRAEKFMAKKIQVLGDIQQKEGTNQADVEKMKQTNELDVEKAIAMLNPEERLLMAQANARAHGDAESLRQTLQDQIKLINAQGAKEAWTADEIARRTFPYNKILESISNPAATPFTMRILNQYNNGGGGGAAAAKPGAVSGTGQRGIASLMQRAPAGAGPVMKSGQPDEMTMQLLTKEADNAVNGIEASSGNVGTVRQ